MPASPARQSIILLNKPYGTVCRFGREAGRLSLADWVVVAGVYPAGRLDRDSEGLVALTADGPLAHRITHPQRKLGKEYWVQVEGEPTADALARLRAGVSLREGRSRPVTVAAIPEPADLWPRDPPVRFRRTVPTTWLRLTLHEGRNRQVRRMCAAVGYPVLRLIRHAIGPWHLAGLQPGEWRYTAVPAWLRPDACARQKVQPHNGGNARGVRTHHRRRRNPQRSTSGRSPDSGD